jgi:hypothetical protein
MEVRSETPERDRGDRHVTSSYGMIAGINIEAKAGHIQTALCWLAWGKISQQEPLAARDDDHPFAHIDPTRFWRDSCR